MKNKLNQSFLIKQKHLVHDAGIFKLQRVTVQTSCGRTFQHHIIDHRGAAVIVPVLQTGEFVMVRQYRTALNKPLLEFPAGTLEKGEAPLECAKREIVEEIGYEAKAWRKLVEFHPAPGISAERMYIYLATHLKAKTAEADLDEYLRPEVLTYRQLKTMVEKGKVEDGKTIIGFYYYSQWRKTTNQ